MKRRLLTCALALVMVLGMLTGGVLAADHRFPDVTADDWYYDAVRFAADNGLMAGTGAGFEPERPISRAMLWTVLARLDGQNAKRSVAPDWYAAAQLWAVRKDISDGSDPNGTLTREQLAAMLYRFAARKGFVRAGSYGTLDAFSDASAVSGYALEAMTWAIESGMMTGMDGRLDPQGSATRAQVAQILYRLCESWGLPEQDDGAAAAAVFGVLLPELMQHRHSWQTPEPNGDSTHTFTCECGQTLTEKCAFEESADGWKCSVCGFVIPEDEAIETWEQLEAAVMGSQKKSKLFIVRDIAMEHTLSLSQDTAIYGCGHRLTLAENVSSTMFDAKNDHLTLHGLTLDGEGGSIGGEHGAVNAEDGGVLTLEDVTIENFTSKRIVRAVGAAEVTLRGVTIRKNKTAAGGTDFVLLLTNVPEIVLKDVSITENESANSLIGLYATSAAKELLAENLTIENNTITGNHILATSGTNSKTNIDLVSGSICGNTLSRECIYMVGNLTIGEGMLVEGDIVLNNDSSGGVCTLTNNGMIRGNISSAKWAVDSRGCPIYTGSGTCTGSLTGLQEEH